MHRSAARGGFLALALVFCGPGIDTAADPSAAAAGGAEAAQAIVGTWRLERTRPALHITFEADGTYRAVSPQRVFLGRWAIVEDNRIATWSDAAQPKRINGFALDGDALVIIDQRGYFHKHRRVDAGEDRAGTTGAKRTD